jgi:hypothetical protein
MKKSPSPATREAMGCFLMLILGTLMMIGLVRLAVPNGIMDPARGNPVGWRRSVLTWVVAPAVGIALVAWFTYGFKGIRGLRKRG